jgi:hypothetical protein
MTSISERGSFSPLSISGCQLWLDAADATTITGTTSVTAWRDKSGNGYVMTNNQGTTSISTASLNSLNTVYTPSGTNSKITNFVGRTKCTMFLVGKAAISRYLLSLNGGFLYTGNDSLLYFQPPIGTYLDVYDTVGLGTSVVSNNTWFMMCIGYDNATNNTANPYTINGTSRTTAIVPRGSPGILTDQNITSTLYINSTNGTNSYDSVYTAEIIYYNDTLTTSQRQQVEGYLAWKWGLQGSLPGAHPNFSVSGYTISPFPSFILTPTPFKARITSPFFSPTSISGCTLFLDASDPAGTGTPPANGSTVSTWVDKSGLGNNFSGSATYGLDATYNKYRLNFGGNTFNKVGGASNLVTNSTYCIFTVHRFYSNSGGPGHIYRAGDRYWFRQHNQFVNWITDLDPEGYIFVNANDIGINGIGCLNTPTTTSAVGYLNGTSVGSSLKGSGTNFSFYIGNEGLSAAIFEILVYNIALTDSQRQQVEGYLAWKWGIQSLLPRAHPNFSVNGTVVGPFPLAVLTTTPFKSSMNSPFFSPLSIAGSSFWFDGSDSASLVLSGSNITRWNDKSGRAYHLNAVSGYANATVSSAYQNGLNVINFSGNGLYRAVANSAVYPQDVYIIVSLKSLTAQSDVLAIGPTDADNFNSLIFSEGTQSRWKNGSSYGVRNVFSTVDETSRGVLLIQWSIANNNYLLRRNGTLLAQSSSFSYNLPAGSIFQVGFRHTDITSANFSGYIGEILVYNTQLGSDQRQQVEGYLAWKWGIQSSLPGTHPNFSANGYIVTPFPSFIISATPPVDPTTKYSALFNAANNPSLTIPANSALTLGTNNHTIEFWMYQTSRNQYAVSFSYGNTSYYAANNYYMDVGEAGFGFVVGNGSGGWAVNVNGGAARSLNTWLHYAIVRNGNTFTLYIDGISVGSGTSSINITAQGDVFRIGNTTTYPITGYISNFRVVNGTAVYTSNFNPPTSPLTAIPNTQLLLQGLTDRGPNAFTITNNGGVTLSTSISPFA